MKISTLLFSALSLLPATLVLADEPQPPVPVVPTMPPPPTTRPADNQQLYGGPAPLVTPEAAKALIDKFRAAFAQSEGPRFVFYVNRELIDAESGLKLTQRLEHTDTERHDVKSADMESPAPGGAHADPGQRQCQRQCRQFRPRLRQRHGLHQHRQGHG